MQGIREHALLPPTQMSQRSYSVAADSKSYTTLSTPFVDYSMNAYVPWGWRTLERRRRRFYAQLTSPLALFSLLASTILIVTLQFTYCQDAGCLRTILSKPKDSNDYDTGAPFAPLKIQRLWGHFSPYQSVRRYQHPPTDCRLTQVNILQRHGARYPTLKRSRKIEQALLKLQAAESYTDKGLQFLTNYTYNLGVADLLPFGELESFESGRKAFFRYVDITSETNLPFIRASGVERVTQSALKWAEGFGVSSDGVLKPPLALIIPKSDGFNNTLRDGNCPNADYPRTRFYEWRDRYAKPISDRLNSGAQGLPANLTAEDVHHLIMLCALETVAREKYSPFCRLFSEEEFKGFEYGCDLEKFYFRGRGSELGPVQGVGYINELLARLTDQSVRDHTQTNHTLDSNPDTFPLGRGIYADFTHDNLILAVVSAMGLFDSNESISSFAAEPMNPRKPDKHRMWVMSRIIPFSGRLVVERMECGLPSGRGYGGIAGIDVLGKGKARRERQRRRQKGGKESSVYVRLLVNDAVQGLGNCKGMDEDGLCPLYAFVKSQEYAREDGKGDWEKCF